MSEKYAIILTAGVGSRLKELTDNSPKTLIKINDKPILDYQIELYRNNGFNKIIIVTGYLSKMIENEYSKFNDIDIVVNEVYKTTNNMYSLNIGLEHLNNTYGYHQTWISNGDVIYESFNLSENNDSTISGIYVDKSQYFEESMKIIIAYEKVKSISKKISEEDYYGISMDMYKFTIDDIKTFHETIQGIIQSGEMNQWTEVALQNMIENNKINFYPIEATGTIWWEIDDKNDIIRAENRLNLLKNINKIKEINTFVYDMDGTINNGMLPIEGVEDFLRINKINGINNIILSNNSSYSKSGHQNRVKNIFEDQSLFNEIISSNDQMIDKLKEDGIKKCYFLLPKDVIDEYEQNGILNEEIDPDIVVAGFDKELTYEKLEKASIFIQNGLDYYLVHKDLRCPTENGFIPDAGSIVKALELTTNTKPKFIGGKPNREFIDYILKKYNITQKRIAYIGDRFSTDMMIAINSDIMGMMVLSGEESLESYDKNKKQYDKNNNIILIESINFLNYFLNKHKN